MQQRDCLLCTHNQDCDGKPLVLHPETPMLKEILQDVLNDEGMTFRMDSQGLFLLDRAVNDEAFADLARRRLNEREAMDVRIARRPMGGLMNSLRLDEWLKRADYAWFDQALSANSFTSFFQPIVRYGGDEVFGHECLIRLVGESRTYNGGEIIEAAFATNRIHMFDSYARRLSIRCSGPGHVAGSKVFVNFMPSSIYDPAYCMRTTLEEMTQAKLQAADVVFEVVESDGVVDSNHLRKICNYYRDSGFGFALDDVGTGSNSIQAMCDLQPDYIKIDKSLIWKLKEPMHRSAVQKIVDLAREYDVEIIAEGIEDQETAALAASLGITLMQGYYFGRPSPQRLSAQKPLAFPESMTS